MKRHASQSRDRGTVLLLAVIVTLVVTMIVATMVTGTVYEAKSANVGLDQAQAMAVAEGVTEAAQRAMLTAVANFREPPLGGTITVGTGDYAVDQPYTVEAVGDSILRTDPDGVTMAIQPYAISAVVDVGNARSNISRVVELTMTPIFQYMIFYDDDLEILPGPSMTIGGRVHCNGDIYVGCGGTLTVNTEYFRATGDIQRNRKNDGSVTGGTVNIKVAGTASSYVNMTNAMDSDHANWTALALDTWHGTVQSADHGTRHVAAPEVDNIKAFDADGNQGYYHQNAGLVVVDGQAYDGDGNLITLPAGVLREVDMRDGREGTTITVTEIDIGALNAAGYFPDNGLIYAYRTDATPDQPNGIRLTNGAELPAPMTVVTEDPIFVKGNFNTIEKKGAAVIADAVNLLSNSWNDTKGSVGLPNASNTTFNVAMISGNVPTPDGGGSYSGGFENMPRFHENWTGRTATIQGSFISLYASEIATAPWVYGGNCYTAPTRNWSFDPALQDIENMPPFTPNAVYFRRVAWDDNIPVPFTEVGPAPGP